MLQDNVAMATKTINSVQRLLGDSIAIVKNQHIINTKLKHVLQMESHLHCDEGEPLTWDLYHVRSYDPSHECYTQLLDEPVNLFWIVVNWSNWVC